MDTIQFSQAELVQHIWTNRDVKSFRSQGIKQADLNVMSIDDLTALAIAQGISLEPETKAEVSTEELATATDIRTVPTSSGTMIHVIDLPLLSFDGATAYFDFQNKKVMIGSDLDLIRVIQAGEISIGDLVPFHYHGVDTWKTLSYNGVLLVPNNSGARAEKHSSSGTIAKFICEPIQKRLEAKKAIALLERLDQLEIAEQNGLSIRDVRKMDKEDRVADAREQLRKKREARNAM